MTEGDKPIILTNGAIFYKYLDHHVFCTGTPSNVTGGMPISDCIDIYHGTFNEICQIFVLDFLHCMSVNLSMEYIKNKIMREAEKKRLVKLGVENEDFEY
jgi:hypothetical protein